MKHWWQNLQQREQQLITAGTLALILVILWAFVWLPYQQKRVELQSQISSREQQLIELSQISAHVQALRKIGQPGQLAQNTKARGTRSLLQVTDESARAAGLAAALKRIEPDTENMVQVWLEGADFDKLAGWLELIDAQYAISVESASINRPSANISGAVNAHITLTESG